MSRIVRSCLIFIASSLLVALSSFAAEVEKQLIIDTHAHIVRNVRGNLDRTASTAMSAMDENGVTLTILLPPPFPDVHKGKYGRRELAPLTRDNPSRFAFVAGGESLNGMIQAVDPDRVTPRAIQEFNEEAEAIVRAGAVGFGEITAEHFSSGRGGHPYESTRPDHPLLLALADIAAKHGIPIDLHMEAIPQDMAFPRRTGGANPERLKENISGLERLLIHNPGARIVWAHAGWDLTEERTVPLMRTLLAKYPNLYMSVKVDPVGSQRTSPMAPDGGIKPGWLALLNAFPDRFVIGSDQFFDEDTARLAGARRFVNALPADLAPAIARRNAERIYKLDARPLSSGGPR